jgi:hypothetical protein
MTSYAWTHTSVVIHRCRGHQVWSKCLFKTRQKAASIIPIPTHPQHHSLPYIPKHFHATCSCVSACDSFEGPTAHCWLSCCDKSCGIKHCRASSKVTYTLPLILRLAYTCYRCIYFTHMQLLISHKSGCPFQDKASPKRVILGQRRAPRPSDIAIHDMHAHYAHLSYREVDMITLKTPQKISSCSSASQALSKQVAWAIAVKSCTQVADDLGTFIGKLWHTVHASCTLTKLDYLPLANLDILHFACEKIDSCNENNRYAHVNREQSSSLCISGTPFPGHTCWNARTHVFVSHAIDENSASAPRGSSFSRDKIKRYRY